MNFCVRPSKSFLYDFLESKLSRFTSGVALDAGSNKFKNIRFFKTDKYFGLDINLSALQSGLARYRRPDTFGIFADLEKLDALPENSVDIIVSTYTLYSLPREKRMIAIEQLCRLISPDGHFFCELTIDNELGEAREILQKNFKKLKIIYFKNIFSQIYESIFEKDGYLGSHPIAGLRPMRLFAWLLSRLEYLTWSFPGLNRHVLIICSEKKRPSIKNEFNLLGIKKIEDRLYSLLN